MANRVHSCLMQTLKRKTVLILCGTCAATFSTGCGMHDSEKTIRDRLMAQAAAWNRCDLDGFMDGYWKSDELVFESTGPDGKTSTTRGWQPTLDRYKKRYDTPAKIGKLTFSNLAVRMTGAAAAVVTGRYEVMQAAARLTGSFVLDMRRIDGKWVIVRDRTTGD